MSRPCTSLSPARPRKPLTPLCPRNIIRWPLGVGVSMVVGQAATAVRRIRTWRLRPKNKLGANTGPQRTYWGRAEMGHPMYAVSDAVLKGQVVMDKTSVDDILDFAILSEQSASEFYTDLAAKMDNQAMRDVFEEFARQELAHKDKLLKVRRQLVPRV